MGNIALKRLAIFCDGTWNKPENENATNVERLSEQIPEKDPSGNIQKSFYLTGVGEGRGDTRWRRFFDKFIGGALGLGLDERIIRAYSWLAHEYLPGDEIYIFGFSRGAYTARSLAGMIRAAGLPDEANLHRIPEAFDRYRDRDERTKPGSPESAKWRLGYAPLVHTGEAEKLWREDRGHPPGDALTVAYLGIWDTVGALGVPGVLGLLAERFNATFLFHDLVLSRSVTAGRHAIAIDERRRLYEPTPWINLDQLNGNDPARPFRQEWFPGDHGKVGGNSPSRGLSDYTLDWIIEGAARAGLHVDQDFVDLVHAGRRFGGPVTDTPSRRGDRARPLTDHTRDVSIAAQHRLAFGDARGQPYDPETLRPLRAELAPRLPSKRDPDWP